MDALMRQVDVVFSKGDFDTAARLLNDALRKRFDRNMAMSLLGIHIHRDAASAAAQCVAQLYQALPELRDSGLREMVLAFGIYNERRKKNHPRNSVSGPAEPWQMARFVAAAHHVLGEYATAKDALESSRPLPQPGTLVFRDGRRKAFGNLRDADDMRSSMFVCLESGRVADIPFTSIRRIDLPGARTFYGAMLPPALVTLCDGRKAPVRVPLRYPESGKHKEASVRLARTTLFDHGYGYCVASGMVDYFADTTIVGLGSLRAIEFH
ncbi:MAG: type VI secretion system accessory protein TagJ [Polyangiales bacterium]